MFGFVDRGPWWIPMTSKALGKIWSFLGVLAFGFALTSFMRTTGSDVSDYILPLSSAEPFSAALVSWPLLAALIATLLYVTRLYANQSTQVAWFGRLPVFYFEDADVDFGSSLGKRYQCAIAILFIGLPLVLQAAILAKAFHGTAFAPDKSPFAASWQHFHPRESIAWSDAIEGAYRFGDAAHGVTYYPLISAYGYGVLELALLGYLVAAIRSVRTRPSTARRHARRHSPHSTGVKRR